MTVTLLYAIFDDCDVIARSAVITNEGSALLVLERADSLCLELPDDRYDLITLSGDWARERDVIRRRLNPGHQGVSSLRGASSHQASPFAALVYSGSFFATADVDEQRCTRLRMGLNDRHFRWTLSAGESFHVPEAVLAYSAHGMDGMSAQFHTLCREHIVRGRYAHAPRPILLNNWEATYFSFDEDKLVNIAEKAAQMGIELFVLDDGWFGHRDDDRTSLRDWTVDHRKLPNGLRRLADRVHAMGMKFGLWFEPEMVSPDSDLFRADVCDFIYRAVADVLCKNGIDNVKWDMNRNFSNVGSTVLTPCGCRSCRTGTYSPRCSLKAAHPAAGASTWACCITCLRPGAATTPMPSAAAAFSTARPWCSRPLRWVRTSVRFPIIRPGASRP